MAGLTIWRKPGERVLIGDDIVIEVVERTGRAVCLNIVAPPEVAVDREELRAAKRANPGGRR